MKPLTQKQENFCLKYVECGNASEAYRFAYDAGKMKPETIWKRANELLGNGAVPGRISEIKQAHAQRHRLTVDDLLAELEENRQAALQAETVQASAATAATMGKAKLLGLDKKVIDHQSSDGSMSPKPLDVSKLSTGALAEIMELADEEAAAD